MKKVILPIAIICCSLTSAFAQDAGRRGDNRRDQGRGDIRDIKECLVKNDLLKSENQSLLDKLTNCKAEQDNRGDREKLDRIQRENDDLILRNQNLLDQVEKLKIDNARLDMEAHPERGGRFDLASSIMACGKIQNAVYAQQCSAAAKANSIQANVIEQCAKISNAYYALECVKSAGLKETSARQVAACLGIDNAVYAQQCVQVAGEKRVSAEVINSCVKTSTNTYYQLECIKNM